MSEHNGYIKFSLKSIDSNEPLDTAHVRDVAVNNINHLYEQSGQVRVYWQDNSPIVRTDILDQFQFVARYGPFVNTITKDNIGATLNVEINAGMATQLSDGTGSLYVHLRRRGESILSGPRPTRGNVAELSYAAEAGAWVSGTVSIGSIRYLDDIPTRISGSETARVNAQGAVCYLDIFAKGQGATERVFVYGVRARELIDDS